MTKGRGLSASAPVLLNLYIWALFRVPQMMRSLLTFLLPQSLHLNPLLSSTTTYTASGLSFTFYTSPYPLLITYINVINTFYNIIYIYLTFREANNSTECFSVLAGGKVSNRER